jgi:hypothetical protein
MNTLRAFASRAQNPFPLVLGEHFSGSDATVVTLIIYSCNNELHASLVACHKDHEGEFEEEIPADIVLDKVGQDAIDKALQSLRFESGVPTEIYTLEDLAYFAPQLLDC